MDPVSFRPDVKNGLSERLRGTFRFDAFELDIRSRELRKHGIRIRLQNKSFQFLIALLERPGEVVTRQELQRHLCLVTLWSISKAASIPLPSACGLHSPILPTSPVISRPSLVPDIASSHPLRKSRRQMRDLSPGLLH